MSNTCKLVARRHVLMLVLLAVYKLLDLTILRMRISITFRSQEEPFLEYGQPLISLP